VQSDLPLRSNYPTYTQFGDLGSCPKKLLEGAGSIAAEFAENATTVVDK
jgi:hypothetical protein